MSGDKCPPQFVFDIAAAQVTRLFINDAGTVEDIVAAMAGSLGELYDQDDLSEDLMSAVERIMIFIGSVEISDVDLMLFSFIYYRANYDDLKTKKNKKPLFGGLLKGRPKEASRGYFAAKAFSSFAYAVGSKAAPAKPDAWTPDEEVELESVMKIIFPPPPPVDELALNLPFA